MKVSLKVIDRLMIWSCLPSEESIITLRNVREIKKLISFSDEERKALDLKESDGRTVWSGEKPEGVEFEFTPNQFSLIGSCLKKMEEKKKLTEQHIDIYDKFVVSADKPQQE